MAYKKQVETLSVYANQSIKKVKDKAAKFCISRGCVHLKEHLKKTEDYTIETMTTFNEIKGYLSSSDLRKVEDGVAIFHRNLHITINE